MPALPRDLAGALVCLLLTVGCGQSPGGQSGGSGVDSAGSQVDVAADDGSDASTSHASDTQLADGVSSDSGGDDASAKVTQDSTAEIDDAAGGLSDASAQGDGEQGDGEQGDGEQGDGEQGDATASDAADGGTDKGDVGATSTYVMGDCGPGAPGYNSCVIQAALACLKPVGACKLTTSGAHQSTEWASGSSFGCTTDGGKDQIECTGLDGTGKACMTWTFTGLAAKSVTSTLKSGNKTYTMSFNGGGIQVTCADGSKETYATEKDLCSPMKSDGCTKTGGGSTCTPLVTCKPGGICPTGYSCHPGSNGCAQPCQPQGQCPPCRTCDGSTGLCI